MMATAQEVSLRSVEASEEHFNRIFEQHFEAVRRYVWRRDPSLCDDVLGETFLIAWRRLNELPDDARPWLIGVARNVRLNLQRSARRQRSVFDRLVESASPRDSSDPFGERDLVRAGLSQLREADREVLLLSTLG